MTCSNFLVVHLNRRARAGLAVAVAVAEVQVGEEFLYLVHHLQQVSRGSLPPETEETVLMFAVQLCLPDYMALVGDVDGHGFAALDERSNHQLQFVLGLVHLLRKEEYISVSKSVSHRTSFLRFVSSEFSDSRASAMRSLLDILAARVVLSTITCTVKW